MAFSLMYWKEYTHDSTKLSRRSENAVDSNRVLRFVYDAELQYIQANVQASMRDTSYKVRVGSMQKFEFEFAQKKCSTTLG